MPDTGNAKDYLELPPTTFSIFTLKNVTWRTYLISFTVQCCFLFCFVSIQLVSLIWVLQIWGAIYVYGTRIFNKEINANIYHHSLWEYSKRFHCSFEWHLTPHMTLFIETCIRRTPCIKWTLQHSPRVFRLKQVSSIKKYKKPTCLDFVTEVSFVVWTVSFPLQSQQLYS